MAAVSSVTRSAIDMGSMFKVLAVSDPALDPLLGFTDETPTDAVAP